MLKLHALVEGIRSLTPSREIWATKPAEELPEIVTVTFEGGQSGILDMKNPRATHWAEILERLEREKGFVYVEIDPETNVITRLRIPRMAMV
jgi:hypothetical protein